MRRFTPCEWTDLACHALVDIAAASRTSLPGIVGHHKNAGTWLKSYENAAAPVPLARRLRSAGALPFVVAGATAAVLLLLALALRRRRRGAPWPAGGGVWWGWHGGHVGGPDGGGRAFVEMLQGGAGKEGYRESSRGVGGFVTGRRPLPPPVSAAAVVAAGGGGSGAVASGGGRYSGGALPRPGSASQLGLLRPVP